MKGVDTNILVRYLTLDDAMQATKAREAMAADVFISSSILLETAWLLRSRYGLTQVQMTDALLQVVRMRNVIVADEEGTRWALERARLGADFADMVHLNEAKDTEAFVTFDRALSKQAGRKSPVPIETLA